MLGIPYILEAPGKTFILFVFTKNLNISFIIKRFKLFFSPVDDLVRVNVQPGQSEHNRDLKDDKKDHQKVVDAVRDLVARLRRRGVHLKEPYQLHHQVAEGHHSKHKSTTTNWHAHMTLQM